MADTIEVPTIIKGGLAVDDRGQLTFANDFDFKGVKRFYMVENHAAGFVRAWHGHKKEAKYVMAVSGAATVAAVKVDDWENPSQNLEIHRYVLSSAAPSLLYIPAGYANGFMSLTLDAKLMFFSTSAMEDTKGDDIRFDALYWDIWTVEQR